MKLVESVAKPGGNVTGLSNFGSDLAGKRLQILKENVPNPSRVWVPYQLEPAGNGYVHSSHDGGGRLNWNRT